MHVVEMSRDGLPYIPVSPCIRVETVFAAINPHLCINLHPESCLFCGKIPVFFSKTPVFSPDRLRVSCPVPSRALS